MTLVVNIRQRLQEIVSAALLNSHYKNLPDNPEFPALIWEVETAPEEQWSMGGGYDRHTVNIIVLDYDADAFQAIIASVRAAIEADPYFQYEDSSGDSEYEPNPLVYGQYLIANFRTPRY